MTRLSFLQYLAEDLKIQKRATPRTGTLNRNLEIDLKGVAYDQTTPTDFNKESLSKSNTKLLGVGVDAIVFHNPHNPREVGVVNKWLRNQNTPANKNAIIQFLIKGNKLGNPFIPVIYSIREIQTKTGKYDFHIKSEKFYSTLNDIDLDVLQLQSLFNQMFNKFDIDFTSNDTALPIRNDPYNIKRLLSRVIRTSITEPRGMYIYTDLKDKTDAKYVTYTKAYGQAIALIRQMLKANTNLYEDSHMNNMMIRVTSSGLQLVFNDPLVDTSSQPWWSNNN